MRITIELPDTGLEEDILRKGEWKDDSLFGRSIRNALMNFNKESLEQESTYTSQIAQKSYEDGKKDGYVQAKLEQEPVLDKIRAEVDKLDVLRFSSGERIYKDEVLDIIDKYKTENITGSKIDKVDCENTKCERCINHKYCDYENT